MKYRVILHNDQGAVLDDVKCNTVDEIKDLLDSYSDPENISLTVYRNHEEVPRQWYVDNGFVED